MQLKSDGYPGQGLYVHCPDGSRIDLSKENIGRLADQYWNDPAKLSPQIRQHEDFKTCCVCPYRGQDVFCSAVKPLLPFIDNIERFVSYSRVTAVYVEKGGLLHIVDTSMQGALQYLTNMSIFEYCEDLKQYRRYFCGITPMLEMDEAVCRLFFNVYWLHRGDRAAVDQIIREIHEAVTVTTQNCVKRLHLLCKSDAFKNAYVRTHTLAEYLQLNMDTLLDDYFKRWRDTT